MIILTNPPGMPTVGITTLSTPVLRATSLAAGDRLGTLLPPIVFSAGQTGMIQQIPTLSGQVSGTARNDRLDGSLGNDRMRGNLGNDILKGRAGNDHISGEAGNDLMLGGDGNDVVLGGDGNDMINGENGVDRLVGDLGDDVLTGGRGIDTLTGGAGRDTFRFNALSEVGDTITDFNVQQDLFDLRYIFAQPNFRTIRTAQQLRQVIRVEQAGTGTRVMVDTDGVGAGTNFMTLAVLQNVAPATLKPMNFAVA